MAYIYTRGLWSKELDILLLGKEDSLDEPHTLIANGKEGNIIDVAGVAWDAIGCFDDGKEIVLIGEDGEYVVYDGTSNLKEGEINTGGGNFMCTGVKRIGKEVFIHGMNSLILRRTSNNNWVFFNKGIDENNFGLEDISGNSAGECYIVGWRGEIYQLQQNVWNPVASPTNAMLTSCLVAEDGAVCICGRDGTVLVGKGDEWELLDHSYPDEDFWKVIAFNNKRFIAGTSTIFELKDNSKLVPTFGWYLPEYGAFASCIDTPDGFWVLAERKIIKYKNHEWITD